MRRPLHVLELQGAVGPGGSERHTLQLALGLHARPDFRVTVVGPYRRNPKMHARLVEAGIPLHELDLEHKQSSLRTLRALIRLIRRERVDIIHTHLRNADLLGIAAGLLTRTPVVTTIHGRTGPLYGDAVPLRSRLMKRLHSLTLRVGTKRIIAISAFIRDFTVADLGLPLDRFVVVHNATDPTRFAGPFDTDTLRRELAVPSDTLVVSIIGGLSRQKGAHYFLEMARQVSRRIHDVRFLIVGEGQVEAELHALARRLDIADRVIFTGWRPDVPALLHLTDVLVMTARDEGFGRVITEAMAVGTPVVAFAEGAVPEIVVDGETGFLVPYAYAAILAERVLELLADFAKRDRMGRNGFRRLEEHFSVATFISKTAAILCEVVQR